MKISRRDWQKYITLLRKISNTAADKVAKYIDTIDINSEEGIRALLDYSYAVATKYGEGATALACQMYDEIASLSGASVPIAEPAATATYGEVAMSVRGKMMDTLNPDAIGAKVGLLVRRAGMDTTLHNAIRDGAEWAWIPSGDTCPFCLVLASNGWQKASSKVLKGNHADHIHANCDCSFVVRFDNRMDVEGYDPEALYDEYMGAAEGNSTAKINALRRRHYAANKNKINAQKRAAYAKSKGRDAELNSSVRKHKDITKAYLQDAIPRQGIIDYEEGFNKKDRPKEVETAQIIHSQLGGNIILRAEKQGQKNPDYEWMQSLWDLKNPTSEKAANSAIKSGMKQIRTNPGGIILNYENTAIDMKKLLDVIGERMKWYPEDCVDIIIIRNNKIIKVLRY